MIGWQAALKPEWLKQGSAGGATRHMKLKIRPLTPSLWPALEDLFGKGGACNGCWCMYWRIGPEYHKRPREKNKSAFHRIVKQGPPPGLLAFDGERPVGWCQLTPRQDLSWLNRKPSFQPVDDVPVWALSCFYIWRPTIGSRRNPKSWRMIQIFSVAVT
jgi:hypothetical protein